MPKAFSLFLYISYMLMSLPGWSMNQASEQDGDKVVYIPKNTQAVRGIKRNVLTQEMISQTNAVYVIQHDFVQTGNITIPANSTLKFEAIFGSDYKTLVCWSGTPQFYIDIPRTSEREFKDGSVTKFLFVGQTIKRKYPKETIEAIHQVYGDETFEMAYVGTKDFAYQETIDYISEHHLSDRVVFTGRIPRDEIVKFYDKSECFILISSGEVFGLVYLEAMSRGCITIAGKREGMEGIIEHGMNGYLCEPGDVKELSDILRQINSLTAEEKTRISEKAKETAVRLSEYYVAKKYLEDVLQ